MESTMVQKPETDVGPTTPVEETMRTDKRRFRVVAIVAALLLAPQVLANLYLTLRLLPVMSSMYGELGAQVPLTTRILLGSGSWLGFLLVVADALVFWFFYRFARRYWIGLLFAPLFVSGLLSGAVLLVAYLPMYDVVTLVK